MPLMLFITAHCVLDSLPICMYWIISSAILAFRASILIRRSTLWVTTPAKRFIFLPSVGSADRAWTENQLARAKTSFHSVGHGERWLRPRSFRNWGLWSGISILSSLFFFLGHCHISILFPLIIVSGFSFPESVQTAGSDNPACRRWHGAIRLRAPGSPRPRRRPAHSQR